MSLSEYLFSQKVSVSCNPYHNRRTGRSVNTKQIVLKVHSENDWLLELRMAFAIHFRATRAGVAPENIVIVFTSVSVKGGGYHLYFR